MSIIRNMSVIYTTDICAGRQLAGFLDGLYVCFLVGLLACIYMLLSSMNKKEETAPIVINVYMNNDDDCDCEDEDEEEEEEEEEDEEEEEEEEKQPVQEPVQKQEQVQVQNPGVEEQNQAPENPAPPSN